MLDFLFQNACKIVWFGSKIFLLTQLFGHGFFICWITLHLLKFQSAAIGKEKATDVLINSSRVLYCVSDNFSKKYEICLQDNLGFFLFVGLHYPPHFDFRFSGEKI